MEELIKKTVTSYIIELYPTNADFNVMVQSASIRHRHDEVRSVNNKYRMIIKSSDGKLLENLTSDPRLHD